MALSESQLIVPALIAMLNSPGGQIQTSDLIEKVADQFVLDNHDLQILDGRNDEKFTQMVQKFKIT